MDCESLLGTLLACARRFLMLSTDDNESVRFRLGVDFFGERLGNVEASAFGSVGVGGVTKVVGVSERFGGVAGSVAVLTLGRPRRC